MRDKEKEDRNLLLARAGRSGDDLSLNQLLVQNERAIYSIAKRHIGLGISFDDLLQIGREGYWQGVLDFEEHRGANVNTIAIYGARKRIHDEIRYWQRKKRFARTISYEQARVSDENGRRKDDLEIDDCQQFRTLNPEKTASAHEVIRNAQKLIRTRLKPRERMVLCKHFGFDDQSGPLTFVQIAELMGWSRSYPGAICMEALRKIRMTTQQLEGLAELQALLYASEKCFYP